MARSSFAARPKYLPSGRVIVYQDLELHDTADNDLLRLATRLATSSPRSLFVVPARARLDSDIRQLWQACHHLPGPCPDDLQS
jgi:hypothetical protein